MDFRNGLLGLAILLLMPPVANAARRDGTRYDPAATMSERAAAAPEELDQVAWMLGHWNVAYTRHVTADSSYTATGRADITFMNRGHNIMQRLHCADFDGAGHELNTLSFLVYNTALATWGMGVADSWRENIVVFNGNLQDDELILRNAVRHGGNLTLTDSRLVIQRQGNAAFTVTETRSTDGENHTPALTMRYTRMTSDDGLFTAAKGTGAPAPGVPSEARQFDFLIGEWDLQHDMTFPNGQKAQWPAYGTAVHMMNGHAVMEYSSFDVDPSLPDAATTIVRLWNRQMRQWECMYTTNRFNGILHFGGVLEGERIVLHPFNSDTATVPISQWTFHSWKQDSYGWYATTSADRGTTWAKTWIIEATRRK